MPENQMRGIWMRVMMLQLPSKGPHYVIEAAPTLTPKKQLVSEDLQRCHWLDASLLTLRDPEPEAVQQIAV